MNIIDFDENIAENNTDYYDKGSEYNGFKEYIADISNSRKYTADKLDGTLVNSDSTIARNELVEQNTKLVVSVAKQYAKNGVNMSLEDIIQEGNFGLIKAAERFDPSMGYAFSTYAMTWIKQSILRAFSQKGRSIRIPDHMFERMNKVRKAREAYFHQNGTYASDEVIAEALGISVEKVAECDIYSIQMDSIDREIDEESETSLGDLIEDVSVEGPETAILRDEVGEVVREAMRDSLTPQELDIVIKRCGFADRIYTLEELGEVYGVTRERIRQIQGAAFVKLSKNPRLRSLSKAYNSKKAACL
ncbi:RNA polymerase primary sigma factor [Lachnospiraceae bacterium NE2001]|nr:RNA polymerase primary sigma factor [Lachnospiraceae bacterium NE2001]